MVSIRLRHPPSITWAVPSLRRSIDSSSGTIYPRWRRIDPCTWTVHSRSRPNPCLTTKTCSSGPLKPFASESFSDTTLSGDALTLPSGAVGAGALGPDSRLTNPHPAVMPLQSSHPRSIASDAPLYLNPQHHASVTKACASETRFSPSQPPFGLRELATRLVFDLLGFTL